MIFSSAFYSTLVWTADWNTYTSLCRIQFMLLFLFLLYRKISIFKSGASSRFVCFPMLNWIKRRKYLGYKTNLQKFSLLQSSPHCSSLYQYHRILQSNNIKHGNRKCKPTTEQKISQTYVFNASSMSQS